MMWGYYGHVYPFGSGMGGFGLFPFLLILGAVLLIWAIASNRSDNGETDEKEESALDILKKRYAKGELSKRQFEDMKKDIR